MADRSAVRANREVVVVDRRGGDGDGPAEYGLSRFRDAVEDAGGDLRTVPHWTATDRDAFLVVGTRDGRVVRRLLPAVDRDPEGVVYRWRAVDGRAALVVAGTDDRGLMYGLLELADRVEARGLDALPAVENRVEFPDNEIRGVDRFVMGPIADEWLYDEGFWEYYLSRLARCRFNRFVLVTGYDSEFMSPPYPFVVDTPGYDTRVADDAGPSREANRTAIRRIGRLCRERGLEFVLGIWQQQPWRSDQGAIVEGLPEGEAYAEYCAAGLRELLVQCPEVDGVQLRVNFESGVTADDDRATAEAFWASIVAAVEAAGEQRGDAVGLDLRAKGLTDGMIDDALETGLDVTVPTKFWCEGTGLPYHNVRMRSGELANLDDPNRARRYSYADLLSEPRAYDVLYRLWVSGTNRVFLWGDPDYARRFSEATRFGDAVGFEVTAPLSLKGGHHTIQEEPWPLFDDPDLRHYEREDERYWAWYLLFGRLGYAADADPDVWIREFRERFGEDAEAVLAGYRTASRVLPLITAFHLTKHPATINWAEMDTGGALFAEHNYNEAFGDVAYATVEPSDPGLFYGIDEYVRDALDGSIEGRYTPSQVADWLADLAATTRDALDGIAAEEGELAATRRDLLMLADLAAFHAHKTRAAIDLCYYRETGDADRLPDARASAGAMRDAWISLAERGSHYHDDLVFAIGAPRADAGHWADRCTEIDADVDALDALLAEEDVDPDAGGPDASARSSGGFPLPSFDVDVPERHRAGESLELAVRPGELSPTGSMRLHYRRADQTEGAFREVAMERDDGAYRATVPGDYLTTEYDLLVYFTAVENGRPIVVPGIYHAEHPLPYRVIGIVDGTGDRPNGG